MSEDSLSYLDRVLKSPRLRAILENAKGARRKSQLPRWPNHAYLKREAWLYLVVICLVGLAVVSLAALGGL